MTNPRPDDKQEKTDKQPSTEKTTGSSSLSYGDLMSLEAKEHAAKAAADTQEKQIAEASRRELKLDKNFGSGPGGAAGASFRTPFTYFMGQKPQYQGRQSDFLHARNERPMADLKPLVDKFLKDTKIPDEHHLTASEQRELEKTRESLAKVTSPNEALNTSLQLAKLYQHLRCVEEAKKATDLSLGIDPENSMGRELFKELEHLRPVDITVKRQTGPDPGALTKSRLRERIKALTGGRVIVVGDMIIDEFLEGKPERISREAPVLILEHVDAEFALGGAANAAHNVSALGGSCKAIGVCGRDPSAAKLAELFEKAGIAHGMVPDPARPTTVKTRILSKAHSLKQQLLRIDRLSREPLSTLVESILIDRLRQASSQYSAVILSDYRAGVITDGVVKACRTIAAERDLKVIVDAQDRLERFQQVTALTPNLPDAEKAVGYPLDSEEAVQRAAHELLELTGAHAVLITRGAQGMSLFQEDAKPITIPPFNRSEVFDVTGAGDTVVAAMTLALVTGATFLEAMALGNLAAGIVVKKHGTAVTTQAEMIEALEWTGLPE